MAAGKAAPSEGAREIRQTFLPGRNWKWFLLRGVLAILLGVLAILFPFSALFAFATVFAAFVFADGIFSLISGIRGAGHRGERWGALVFRGIVGIAIGVLFVLMPFVTTVSYALATLAIVAAWAIVTGIFEIAAAIRLRREIEGEWLLALVGALSILLGIAIPVILWMNPLATILSVAWVIGIYALAAGVALIALAIRLRRLPAERRSGPTAA
jgi:uncharacterized membrane protein HdeD (DUF308 family)